VHHRSPSAVAAHIMSFLAQAPPDRHHDEGLQREERVG
jgi:hypothetical protein